MSEDEYSSSSGDINIKGLSEFTMPSHHRFLEFSNNPDLAPLERRNAVLRASDKMIIDDDDDAVEVKRAKSHYYNEGFAYAEDPDVGKYIYERMMEMSSKSHITRDDIPKTEFHYGAKSVMETHVLACTVRGGASPLLEDECGPAYPTAPRRETKALLRVAHIEKLVDRP